MTNQPATSGIVAREVCKSFGTHVVLDNVDLTADEARQRESDARLRRLAPQAGRYQTPPRALR
jgi:hypothetical protein